jgi:hypothetical protein
VPSSSPQTNVESVSQAQAIQIASNLLSQAGITGTTFNSSGKAATQTNSYWMDGDSTPLPGPTHVAWLCYFVRDGNNPNGTEEVYGIWVDIHSGLVIGGHHFGAMSSRNRQK